MAKHFTPPVRHRWFDDWRGAKGPALKKLVADITAEVEALETRKRKRKAVDQERFEVAVEVVVSNLAHEVLMPSETGRLAILTRNGAKGATRYDNRALGEPLRGLLTSLQDLGLVDWHSSVERGLASSLAPTESLTERVSGAGITAADIGLLGGQETIQLSFKHHLGPAGTGPERRELVDYPETPQTVAMRAALGTLNSFLASADIGFVDDGLGPVDTDARALRRSFVRHKHETSSTGFTFDLSGRLFGGFWIDMRSDRRKGIRIGGEPVANLDYGQMGLRLAYAAVGATPPDGDMYAIEGLEGHRGAVKKAFNTLLNAGAGIGQWSPELTEMKDGDDPADFLPVEWGVARLRAAFLLRHPALAPCLGSGIGLKLMNTESEVLMAVLTEMMTRGIVGLGIHDGLLAPLSKAEEVMVIMEEVAVAKAGTTIPVTVEALS